MQISDSITASLEDYLKAIAHIIAEKKAARAKDISERLGVTMSSVTGALHALSQRGFVNYEPYEVVTLTEKGTETAREVMRRHEGVRDFLVKVLAVEEKTADKVACDMEHSVSTDVLERFIRFVDYLEICPRIGANWIEEFASYYKDPDHLDDCEKCLTICLEDIRARKALARETRVVLSELQPGSKARIVDISGKGETKKRIIDMGVTPGSLVEVERIAPLGDPMEIKVKGYHLSLRLEEASLVSVIPV